MNSDIDYNEAVGECNAYARMGGLTAEIVRDIAHDNGLDKKSLKQLLVEFDYE